MAVATGLKGALLMTYGSPRTMDRADVGDYLARIRGGKAADDELLDEFTRRYQVIGGSPLIEITRAQAAALGAALDWPAAVGMRFSAPSIADAIRELAGRGVDEIAAIISSTIARWDAADTGRRIEVQVGRDLQFIRVNGTVVGALVGIMIYTVGHFL